MKLEIRQLLAFHDNYIYILICRQTEEVAVVDPGTAAPVLDFIADNGLQLHKILSTHHHHDHTGGNAELQRRLGSDVIAAEYDRKRVPAITHGVKEGDTISVGNCRGQVWETPGHTLGHLCFYFPESQAIFCGDTMFSMGCGRLFEGAPEQMLNSLQRIAALPDNTLVYCGHEYTANNLKFALSIFPGNSDLQAYYQRVQQQHQSGQPTVPSHIALEKQLNPFLQSHTPALRQALALPEHADAVTVFVKLRRQKDQF